MVTERERWNCMTFYNMRVLEVTRREMADGNIRYGITVSPPKVMKKFFLSSFDEASRILDEADIKEGDELTCSCVMDWFKSNSGKYLETYKILTEDVPELPHVKKKEAEEKKTDTDEVIEMMLRSAI